MRGDDRAKRGWFYMAEDLEALEDGVFDEVLAGIENLLEKWAKFAEFEAGVDHGQDDES